MNTAIRVLLQFLTVPYRSDYARTRSRAFYAWTRGSAFSSRCRLYAPVSVRRDRVTTAKRSGR